MSVHEQERALVCLLLRAHLLSSLEGHYGNIRSVLENNFVLEFAPVSLRLRFVLSPH